MQTADIWIGIIVPILIGPICAYLMTLRNDYVECKYRRKREKFEEERDSVYNSIKNFYWPVYLNLIYIEQYSYSLPIKNKFRYESGSSINISDNSSDYFHEDLNDSTHKPKVVEIDLDNTNGDIEIGHLSPVPFNKESLKVLSENIKELKEEIKIPLILENITYTIIMK